MAICIPRILCSSWRALGRTSFAWAQGTQASHYLAGSVDICNRRKRAGSHYNAGGLHRDFVRAHCAELIGGGEAARSDLRVGATILANLELAVMDVHTDGLAGAGAERYRQATEEGAACRDFLQLVCGRARRAVAVVVGFAPGDE